MRIVIPFLAALGLILTACGEQGGKHLVSTDGYEYIMHTNTKGATPQPGEYAFFHAQIRNGDSIVYETRVSNPQMPFMPIPPEGVPAQQGGSPIDAVLKTMCVGDSATLFVPIDSLPQTPPDFVGADAIIYDLVLMDIKNEEQFMAFQQEMQAEAEAATAEIQAKVDGIMEQYNTGGFDQEINELESGMKYVLLEPGTGPEADPGDMVSVDYYGLLSEGGESFDNSYQRGQPYTFPLGAGEVISGWDVGLAEISEGAEALLIIPGEMGYGAQGSPPMIPPNAELIFYVNLVKVEKVAQ